MSLPGKLCVGILEEDNPLKSYFRFKPLLVESEGRYVPYDRHGDYPEDGCVRIVPDKNESYHFKARMRRIGLFSVVDLREHPDENDKIRANKNYHEGGAEQNAYIIYSDVVREPAPEMIFEIVPEGKPQLVRPAPHTAAVMQRGDELSPERFEWEAVAGADGQARLIETGKRCPLEKLQVFDLPGFGGETVSFAIMPPAGLLTVSDMPERRPRNESAPVRPQAAESEAPARPEPAPAPKPEAPPAPQPEPAEPESGKPWIHHDVAMMPQPVDPRLPPAQRIMAAQSGMNPRRGRSLHELIDEKWQISRMTQLGQPVGQVVTGAPLTSPVESAVSAVKEAWSQPQLRQSLLDSLGGLEEFGASLRECRETARARDIEAHLEELEARRLAMLDELDHMNLRNAALREELKQQVRREEADSLAALTDQVSRARAERERYEALAAQSRAAAEDARKVVDALTDEELERRLRDFAVNGHMLERLEQLRGEAKPLPKVPETQRVTISDLVARVRERFEAAGMALTAFEAANLAVCLMVSPVLLLGGPVGCGKTRTAALLAEALGWAAADRVAVFEPGEAPLADDERLASLEALPDVGAMLVLDDANVCPAPDPLRGLEARLRPAWRLCLTLQDAHSGLPLPADALDKGFFVRLSAREDAPWRPAARRATAAPAPAALACEVPEAELPAACQERMDLLRKALREKGAALSRRALDDAWRYCALMGEALGDAADPIAILDWAVAQRLLPGLLASAPIEALSGLAGMLKGLPVSLALLEQPLPVMI